MKSQQTFRGAFSAFLCDNETCPTKLRFHLLDEIHIKNKKSQQCISGQERRSAC